MASFAEWTEQQKKKKKKESSEGVSFTEHTKKVLGRDDIEAPSDITATVVDIAPVAGPQPFQTVEAKNGKWYDGWIKKGNEDVGQAVAGTAADAGTDFLAGILGTGEKIVDFFAGIAPYLATQPQGYVPPNVQQAQNKMREEASKEMDEFIKKDLYDEQDIAKQILANSGTTTTGYVPPNVQQAQNKMREDAYEYMNTQMEEDSVLDEKADSLIQSGGQMATSAALNAAGVPWWATTGAASYGAEMESALQQGATHDEAHLSATITAAAEVATEKIAGVKFGGKSLTDAGAQYMGNYISNKVARTAIKYGFDIAGEGAEEVLSGYVSAVGQHMTYADEKELEELFTSEDAWDNFIGGVVMGGVAGGAEIGKSAVTGVDPVTGLNKDEQKVVDKVVEQRIAEQELAGKPVTGRAKAAIEQEVIKAMEEGDISIETIEEVLGGDAYKAYQDTVSREEILKKEFELLGKKETYTLADQQRYAELKQQLEDLETNSQRDQLRTELDDVLRGHELQNTRLAESYYERARRGEAFTADVSKYDAKQQATIQKAIDSGILNNTRKTHRFVDLIAKLSADKGVSFDFTDNDRLKESGFAVQGATVNGFVDDNGNITLNINSSKALNTVVGHEITHILEGTELYTELQNVLEEYAQSKGEYDSRLATLTELYKGKKGYETDFDTKVRAELTADLVGDYLFTDGDFVRHLSTKNRNLFQKIYDEIKYLCKVATAGSQEARELEKVKKAFEDAYRADSKAQKNTAEDGGVVLSISRTQSMSWAEQVNGVLYDGKNIRRNDTLVVGSPDTTLFADSVSEKPLAVPLSVVTKATSGKDITHSIKRGKIAKLDEGIRNAPIVIVNPERNALVYVTNVKQGGMPIVATFDMDAVFDGDEVHQATSIHLRTDTMAMLESLPESATVYVQKKDELTAVGATNNLRGLAANIKFIEDIVPQNSKKSSGNIQYSLTDNTDKTYADAVKNRDWETAEKLVVEAAEKAGYTRVVYHGTEARFTVFDTDEESTNRAEHAWMADYPDGTIFLAESDDVAGYYGDNVMPLLLDTTDIKVFEEPDMYAHQAMDDKYGYEVYNYPVIAVKGKDMTIYATLDNTAVKSALTAEYDDNGELIPLSQRFKHDNPDIRFSLSKSVEESKDLIALHNLKADELLKSLELGGLPMPSIAVIKADAGHDQYGEVSLILPKEAIDPKANRYNKVYGGDAWTPTHPRMEYKPSKAVSDKISDKYYELANKHGSDDVRPLYPYVSELEDYLNRAGGEAALLEELYGDTRMMQVYLVDSGKGKVETVQKETRTEMSDSDVEMNEFFINELGADVVDGVMNTNGVSPAEHRKQYWEQHGDKIKEAYKKMLQNHGLPDDVVQSVIDNTRVYDYMKHIRDAHLYRKNGRVTIKTENDYAATEEAIRQAAGDGYKEWVDSLFKGVEEKSGIRNNVDYFTPSGNRRSWDALHWENTLENVVRAMRQQDQTGADAFFAAHKIFATAAKDYGSIAEIKADSDRLYKMSQDEYDAIKESYSARMQEIANRIMDKSERNQFIAADNAMECIVDAVRVSKTKEGIFRELKQYSQLNVTEADVDDIVALVNDIANMPTGYFEAKPQRAVGFDEVGVFVIPRNADSKLKQELLNRGYSIAEYDPDVEGDRQKVVNQFEEYKFSLSNVGAKPKTYGNYNVYGKDIALAPVQDSVQDSVQDVAPVVETAKPMTADDMISALWDAEFAMQGYDPNAEADATAEAAQEAFSRLRDTDAPPEVEAPYYGESRRESADDPFLNRDWDERKTKAFTADNPDAKPFFQEEAQRLAADYAYTMPAERGFSAEAYYDSNGEKGFYGWSRQAADDINTLIDVYGLSYAQIADGLDAIIHDTPKVNNKPAKTIEFILNKRMLSGYKAYYSGEYVPPNQAYIDWLNGQKRADEFGESFAAITDADAPMDIAPIAPVADTLTVEDVMPIAEAPVAEKHTAIRPKAEQQPRMARATPAEQARADILTEEPTTGKKKGGLWGKVKNTVLDKGMVFEDLSLATGNRELQARWNSIRYAEGKAQRLIGEGNASVKSLNSIREAVEKTGKTKQFYEYLYHQHNVDRMTLADRYEDVPNKAVFGDSVTAQESRGIIAELERKNPEFRQHAKDVYDYMTNLRQMLVDGGVISEETAELWQDMYPHYVPIRRLGDDGLNINVPLDTGKTGVNAPIKRAKGGSRDILPLFDTMGQRTVQTFKAVAKNRFGVELKNTLGTTIESGVMGVDDAIDSIDTQDGLLQEGKNGQKPTFTVFENGEKVTFEITEEMYDAMKPTNEVLAKTIKPLNAVSNFRRATLTEYNPWFMLKNAVKDVQDVLINSQHAARTYAAIPKAIKQMATKGHWYQEYVENGGEQNTYFDNETNTFKKENAAVETIKKMTGLSAIQKANNVVEMMPRLAEYIASRETGRSIDVSMLDAARVTTNFAAGGDLTKFVNRNGATFLNASVQGAMQQVRNIREAKMNGLKGWAKLAGTYTLAGLPALILNNLIWDDDEEYEELSDYVKQNYYIVGKYGDGKFVRIPKGRTVAVIQNAFEQMENAITGDDEVDLKTFVDLVATNLAPNDPVENNIFSPIVQAMNNETWYGEDLVPTRLQDLPAAEQYDESTDSISRWLGEKTDTSPYKWNYLLDQYSGVIGDTFLPMLTPEAESGDNSVAGNMIAPLKDMFTTDSVMKNQNVSDFYDTVDELTTNAKGSKATDEDVLKYKYMNSVNADLGELYKQKREIQNSNLPDDEKYEAVRETQRQIDEMAEEALNSYGGVSIRGDYATVGDRHYHKNDEGEWVKVSDDQLDKQEDVTGALGIAPDEYWENKEEYDYAYKNPEKYAVAKAVGGYDAYRGYSKALYDIKADKDSSGKSISGSRKEKVIDYINGLDIDYGEQIILFKSEYTADDTYNREIVEYLDSREDISWEEMKTILEELDFTVYDDGRITW